MENTKIVKTSVGEFEIRKPKAGIRNKALIAAELSNGNTSRMRFLTNLMPKCIVKRPENFDKDVPIEQVLDNLDFEDYDLLVDAIEDFPKNQDLDKKKTQ